MCLFILLYKGLGENTKQIINANKKKDVFVQENKFGLLSGG